MLISLTAALAVYAVYWAIVCRRHRVPVSLWAGTLDGLKLRSGANGWLRILICWTLAFVVYALVIEDSGELFTWYWLEECLLKGDWIGVLLIATLLTLCERYLAMKRLARLESYYPETSTELASS